MGIWKSIYEYYSCHISKWTFDLRKNTSFCEPKFHQINRIQLTYNFNSVQIWETCVTNHWITLWMHTHRERERERESGRDTHKNWPNVRTIFTVYNLCTWWSTRNRGICLFNRYIKVEWELRVKRPADHQILKINNDAESLCGCLSISFHHNYNLTFFSSRPIFECVSAKASTKLRFIYATKWERHTFGNDGAGCRYKCKRIIFKWIVNWSKHSNTGAHLLSCAITKTMLH